MKFLNQILGLGNIHLEKNEKIFDEIVGQQDVKDAFVLFLDSPTSSNALLDGPPACSKTLFLLAMRKHLKKVFWVEGRNATGPGMLDRLFGDKSDTKYLLIDEIDGLKPSDQKAILNLLETGILSSVKVRNQQEKEFKNLKVFATCNDLGKLTRALKSRFFRISLKEYSEQEFIEIASNLYPKKDPQLVEYVAKAVWKVLGSKDIRDFNHIIKNAKNDVDADKLIDLKLKYKPKEG